MPPRRFYIKDRRYPESDPRHYVETVVPSVHSLRENWEDLPAELEGVDLDPDEERLLRTYVPTPPPLPTVLASDKVIVCNLPAGCTVENVRQFLHDNGFTEIGDVQLPQNQEGTGIVGYAVVKMPNQEMASLACNLNGKELSGSKVDVSLI